MAEKFIERPYTRTYAKTDYIKQQWQDVPYMTGERHDLDIYLPNEGQGPFPVIVDVFGGGLVFGDKSSHKLDPALRLLDKGYAVVSISYTWIQDAPFPTQIYEVKAAIRFIRAHVTEYQLDPERIALMGESSGAHLALLSGVTASIGEMSNRDFGENADQSEKVSAIIALYGPYEFDKFVPQFKESGVVPNYSETGTAESFEGQMFGKRAPKDVPDKVKEYNPATYFSTAMPPILAFVGTNDVIVPYQQTVNMIDAARKFVSDDRAEIHVVEGTGHGPGAYMTPEYTEMKADFLQKWL